MAVRAQGMQLSNTVLDCKESFGFAVPLSAPVFSEAPLVPTYEVHPNYEQLRGGYSSFAHVASNNLGILEPTKTYFFVGSL